MKTEDIKKMGLAFQQVLEKKKKLDPVDKDELDGTHADRDDKDIDNDGDADDTDKFLHKKRKAISKAVAADEMSSKEKMKKGLYNSKETKKESTGWPIFDRIQSKAEELEEKDTHKTKDGKTAKKGLWYNIHKKRERGEAPAKPGDPDRPSADDLKRSQNEDIDENKSMALQKALQRVSRPSAKGKAAVTLAPDGVHNKEKSSSQLSTINAKRPKMENDQVVMDDDEVATKKKKNQETAKMNPKIGKAEVQKEANQELEMVTQYTRPNSVSAMREAMTQMWQESADRNKHYAKASEPETQNDMLKGQGAKDMAADFQSAIAKGDADTTNLEKVFTVNSAAQKAGPNPKHRGNDQKTGDKSIVK